MSGFSTPTAVELLIGTPIIAALLKLVELTFKKFTGRTSGKISNTERINALSVSMLEPIHRELDEAHSEAKGLWEETRGLRVQLAQVRAELEDVMAWARQAKVELDERGITIAPIPTHRIQ